MRIRVACTNTELELARFWTRMMPSLSDLTPPSPPLHHPLSVGPLYSMMASLADRSAFHKTPQNWYKAEPRSDVLQVLAFIKAR